MHLAAVNPDASPRTSLAPRLLRLPAVEARTGLKKSTIYAGIRAGTFPNSVMVGARSVAWRAADIDAWCESRPAKEVGAA